MVRRSLRFTQGRLFAALRMTVLSKSSRHGLLCAPRNRDERVRCRLAEHARLEPGFTRAEAGNAGMGARRRCAEAEATSLHARLGVRPAVPRGTRGRHGSGRGTAGEGRFDTCRQSDIGVLEIGRAGTADCLGAHAALLRRWRLRAVDLITSGGPAYGGADSTLIQHRAVVVKATWLNSCIDDLGSWVSRIPSRRQAKVAGQGVT